MPTNSSKRSTYTVIGLFAVNAIGFAFYIATRADVKGAWALVSGVL